MLEFINYRTDLVSITKPGETHAMNEKNKIISSIDNGGRRSGGDRRKYSYTLHVPERRNGQDRRVSKDRRKTPRYKITSIFEST